MALTDLTGTLCAFTVFILPCVFALLLDREREQGERGLGWARKAWICVILAAATVGFVFGFRAAVKE
eukprot:gene9108-8742_t